LWAATSGVGVALGPIVGGLLLAHFWWGSVFLINVPIAVVGLAFAVRLVPDSRSAAAARPDYPGGLLSITGLTLLVWAIIEAPQHGWSSGLVLGAGAAALVVLAGFALREHMAEHPMLNMGFFRDRRFSAAVGCLGLVMFGLFGALFILTQFLQFDLGYTPLQAGVRILPAAGAVALVAPAAALLVRAVGTKLVVAAGMLAIAVGLWQFSFTTVGSGYGSIVPGMVLLGAGCGLAIPAATASVMGSLPRDHTGVGSATQGTFLQVGGALGIAVVGSLLSTRYQDRMGATLAPYHVPEPAHSAILGSIGGAQDVAARLGGHLGALLDQAARSAFVSGADLGLAVAAAVAAVGFLVALAALPSSARRHGGRSDR
jgi:hypothetical protein